MQHNHNEEVWKPIPGYEAYEISSFGNIVRVVGGPGATAGRKLNPNKTRGYLKVQLWSGGVSRQWFLHRLVMLAFVGPCPDGMQVNHIDGNKANPRLENLEYVTPVQNIHHARDFLGAYKGESHGNSKLTDEKVRQIRSMYAEGQHSYGSIASELSIAKATVAGIVKGRSWSHVE